MMQRRLSPTGLILTALISTALLLPGKSAETQTRIMAPQGENSTSPLSPDQRQRLASARVEDITDENFPDLIESFDYPNAEITDIIKAISELTGKNFIIDPGVRGRITIIAPTQITVAEAYRAFLSALAINGFTVVPSGQFLKVKSARNAQRDSIETYSGDYFPNTDQMITRIIHLRHISAEQVNRDLRILPSKDGEMSIYPPTNSIILSDFGSNIERVMRIINQLDVPGFEEQLEVIQIRHARARDLAELINQIVTKGEPAQQARGRAGTFQAGVPRFSRPGVPAQQQAASASTQASFMVIPDERTNSLIIVGNKAGIERIQRLVEQLDFRIMPEEAGGVYVYYVKHGEAERIAQTLSGIAQDTRGAQQQQRGEGAPIPQPVEQIFGGDVKIVADANTNSLIITASRQDYETVKNLLGKIDIPRDQVYVEAIIMELSSEDRDTWSLGYYQFDGQSQGVGRVGFNGLGNIADILNPAGGQGAILGFGQGESVPIRVGNDVIQVPNLLAFLNLLQTRGRTNVLSTPQIMALDNEEAEIEVGERVPTGREQIFQNNQTAVTTNFENATIRLRIRPFISPNSDVIRMEIDQRVRQVKSPASATQDATLTERSLRSNIVVRDGDTAVLGGLIRDEERETVTKVPLLGDIPILGWLFRSQRKEMDKVNLLVFLTPKIIRNIHDSQNLMDRKLGQRLDYIKTTGGGRDPHGRAIEELPRRAQIPGEEVEGLRIDGPAGAIRIQRSSPSQDDGFDDFDYDYNGFDQGDF